MYRRYGPPVAHDRIRLTADGHVLAARRYRTPVRTMKVGLAFLMLAIFLGAMFVV